MAIVLSLISALAYGISDFLGGLLSRRVTAWQIAVVGQVSATVSTFALAFFVAGDPVRNDWLWAALAGVSTGFGTAFLYRGLSRAKMSIVAPLSAVGSALVPVTAGIALGDRPSLVATLGVILAFPAIVLISRVEDADPHHSGGILDGLLAGLGFGGLFALLGQIGDDAGLFPLALAQAFSILGVIGTAVVLRQPWVPRSRFALRAVVLGPLGAIATGAFLFATHHGLLSIVSVISALYPAATVILAAVVLHERIRPWQAAGLALAATAVALVAAA